MAISAALPLEDARSASRSIL